MTLLSHYIFRQVWGAAVAMTLGLSFLVLLTQSLRVLDLMISAGAEPFVFFQLLALSLPRLVEIVMPISLGAAIIVVGLKLQSDQELTVMKATGASPWRLARPILAACFLTCVLLTTMSFWLTPWGLSNFQAQRQTVKAQFSLGLLQPGVFNFFGDDIMVYFDGRDKDGRLLNMILHDQRDAMKPYTLLARTGELVSDGDIYRLNITDGQRQQINVTRNIVDQLSFSRYEIELPKVIRDISPRWREPDERSLTELLQPLATLNDERNAGELRAELHRRLITPFIPFSIALPVLWLVLTQTRPRSGNMNVVILATAWIGLMESLMLIGLNLASQSMAGVFALYAVAILPALWTFIRLWPVPDRTALILKGKAAA